MTEKDIIKKLAERYIKMIGHNNDQHLRNMCLTIINKIDEYPQGKLNRWLGYIQKSIVDLKLSTITKENKFTESLLSEISLNCENGEEHF